MVPTYRIGLVLVLCLCGLVNAMTAEQAVDALGAHLVADQLKTGTFSGSWLGEPNYTGSITAGLAAAYEVMGEPNYLDSAIESAFYFVVTGNYYGDEAYALTEIARVSPITFSYFSKGFYEHIREQGGGTSEYLSYYEGIEPSRALFYIAHHALAADRINAVDKELFRQAVIRKLSQIDDDTADFPVMALATATWALAQIGPLDSTPIGNTLGASSMWNGTALQDLPDLLLSHQVAADQNDAGSFYWRFDHGDAGLGIVSQAYTDDSIYGTLGLIACYELDPNSGLRPAIDLAKDALLQGISDDGTVYEHLQQAGEDMYVYSGRMLQALTAWLLLPEEDVQVQ